MAGTFALSGIKMETFKKVSFVGFIVIVVFLAVFLSMPTKYYFCLSGGKLGLYVGRIGLFDGMKEKNFEPVFFGEEKDEELKDLLGKKFKTKEDALGALQPVALHRIHRRISALAEIEKSLADQYHMLLGEYRAAQQTGIDGLEIPVEALKGWLKMYHLHKEHTDVSKNVSLKSHNQTQK